MERLIKKVAEHAKSVYPEECCGLVVERNGEQEYIPCKNIHPDSVDKEKGREYNFAIDPVDYANVEDLGKIILIVHSHPNASSRPSKADIARCNQSGIDWLILGYPSMDHRIIESIDPDLVGRPFSLGVYDCYGLIMDYYRLNFGIVLPDFRVDYPWWEEEGNELYLDNYEKAGFYEIDQKEAKVHDVVFIQWGKTKARANHAGIIVSDNEILHHMYGRLSSKDVYNYQYRERTVKIVRYKDIK